MPSPMKEGTSPLLTTPIAEGQRYQPMETLRQAIAYYLGLWSDITEPNINPSIRQQSQGLIRLHATQIGRILAKMEANHIGSMESVLTFRKIYAYAVALSREAGLDQATQHQPTNIYTSQVYGRRVRNR